MRRVSANKNVLSSRLNSVRQMSCCRSRQTVPQPWSGDTKTSIADPWLHVFGGTVHVWTSADRRWGCPTVKTGLWSYLAPFLRYGDLLAKIAYFSYPSHSAPRSLCSLRNFTVKLTMRRLVMGLSYSEDRMIVAWVILTQCQRVTDGRIYYS